MKKILSYSLLFTLILMIVGCSTPIMSNYLNVGDTFENGDIKLTLNEVSFDDNQVSFKMQYNKLRPALPDMSILNIDFVYDETAYDYMQLSEFASDEIYFTSINGVRTDLASFDFVVNQNYTIVLTIDFDYFLRDVSSQDGEASLDFDSIVVYLDVSTYNLRLRSLE